MKNIQRVIPGFIAVLVLGLGLMSCSNSSTNPNSGNTLGDMQLLNLSSKVPTQLQSNSPAAYQMVMLMQTQISMGQSVLDTMSSVLGGNTGEYTETQGQLTATYMAESQTKNGIEGIAWSLTLDGTQQVDDTTTVTFNNDQIFNGWTSNDGLNGNYTFDYSAYTNAANSGSVSGDFSGVYEVQWSEDSDENVSVDSNIQSSNETVTYSLTIDPDGAGSISMNGSVMYEWDSDGNIVNSNG